MWVNADKPTSDKRTRRTELEILIGRTRTDSKSKQTADRPFQSESPEMFQGMKIKPNLVKAGNIGQEKYSK